MIQNENRSVYKITESLSSPWISKLQITENLELYIYIYMGASHMLHSLTTIGFMPIAIAVRP